MDRVGSMRRATSRSLAIPSLAAIALLGAAIPLAWPASSDAAISAAETPGNPARATAIDPLDQIRTMDVMAPLAEDLPLRLALGGSFDDLKPGTHQRLFFATHRHYEGPITEEAVQRLLDAGRGDTLEHRLAPEALEALRREMAEYDEALRDFALLIVAEEQDVKRQLRQRPERCFEIRMLPREVDPEYIRFLRERPAAKDGTVWGDPLKPAGERQIIVLWSDWPGLRKLYDDRTAMIVDRRRRVARWIEGRVRSEGVKIFSE